MPDMPPEPGLGRPSDPYVAAGEVLRAYRQQSGLLATWSHLVSLRGRPAALGVLLARCDTESAPSGDKLAARILHAIRAARKD